VIDAMVSPQPRRVGRFARIGAPAMAAAMRRANRKDPTRLKSLPEVRTG
jgi:hypothetical protein